MCSNCINYNEKQFLQVYDFQGTLLSVNALTKIGKISQVF